MPEPPHNWPKNIHYTTTCSFHSSVPQSIRQKITEGSAAKTATINPPNGPSPADKSVVAIRRISESTHPACGQLGLFAARKIKEKTVIVDYIGEIHCDERPESDYDLSLFRSSDLSVGIDANKQGNEGRFVNDYRGIPGQEKPNAVFVDERLASGELRMRIVSSRIITKGEEILVSYGKAWWQARTTSTSN
ncbi:SET domain protein [Mycena alexandri]|uniref:SET domain protein n=1 Tax=Mycena alexandri TaxID=1745969 RepID=A0AAD6XBS3_9AGAR|nr:SET domain protein [Mycena alexandri]